MVGCDNARMLSWKCTKAHHTFNIRILNETFHCHASTESFWHQSTITLSLHPCLTDFLKIKVALSKGDKCAASLEQDMALLLQRKEQAK